MRLAVLAFIAGLWSLQQQAQLPAQPWAIGCAALVGLGFLYGAAHIFSSIRHWFSKPLGRWVRQLLLCVLCGALGFAWAAWRAELRMAEQLAPAVEGQDIWITGTVENLPIANAQGVRFQFTVEQVEPATAQIPRQLSLAWYSARRFQYQNEAAESAPNTPAVDVPTLRPGERWQLPVRLKQPHGNANPHGFDYELWLLEQGVRATGTVRAASPNLPAHWVARPLSPFVWSFNHVVERSRDVLRQRIVQALPANSPYAGVLVALVVGEQRGIAQDDWEVFNRTGIGHLISISGLHITMLAGLMASLAAFIWRRSGRIFGQASQARQWPLRCPTQTVAALVGALTALLYCWLAGFQIPAQRTLYMLSVVAVAMLSWRRIGVRTVLAWALAVVGVLDPWAVLSPGFWLSFGAVALILYAVQGATTLSHKPTTLNKLWHGVRSASRVQWAVTVGLVPLTLLLFQQVSVVSPLANALAIPLVSGVITPLALLGSVLPNWPMAPFASWALSAAHTLTAWMALGLGWLSEQPWAVWRAATPSVFALLMAGAALLVALAPGPWRWALPSRWLALPLCLPLLLSRAELPPAGEFRATVMDVGQGTAVMIETAVHRLLYDTGPEYGLEADAGNRVLLPWLRGEGVQHLDMLMISHQDADHSGGALSVLAEMPVAAFSSSLPSQHPIREVVREASIADTPCEAGQRWTWDGVEFEVLHPDRQTLTRPIRSDVPEMSAEDQAHYSQFGKVGKTNAKSCTLRISNGAQSLLLTGDVEAPQEAQILARWPADKLLASILLVPHHGSNTSSTEAWLDAVQPGMALVQAGYRNRFGHPRENVLARYTARGIPVLQSAQTGAVQCLTRGKQLEVTAWRVQQRRYWMQKTRPSAGD